MLNYNRNTGGNGMKKIKMHLLLLALGTAIILTGFSKTEANIQTADEEWPRIIKPVQYA